MLVVYYVCVAYEVGHEIQPSLLERWLGLFITATGILLHDRRERYWEWQNIKNTHFMGNLVQPLWS